MNDVRKRYERNKEGKTCEGRKNEKVDEWRKEERKA